jgi:hypothetical protein
VIPIGGNYTRQLTAAGALELRKVVYDDLWDLIWVCNSDQILPLHPLQRFCPLKRIYRTEAN